MPASLQIPLVVGAWILVLLLLVVGFWFLRRHQLLHTMLVFGLILAGVFLLLRLVGLVVMVVLAGVVAFILSGPVQRLEKRMSRGLAIALVYVGLAALLSAFGTLLIPLMIREARLLVDDLPNYTTRLQAVAAQISTWYGGAPEGVRGAIDAAIQRVQEGSQAVTREVERALLEFLRWTIKGILVLVLSIYLLMDQRAIHRRFLCLFPERRRGRVEAAARELSCAFSHYLRGQLTVILFVAVAVTGVLLAFGIRYAVFIGFIAGVLEVIPYFGAISGAVPAVTLGFLKSPGVGISLIIFFIVLNQIEGHVVIPWVMGRHLEMRPLTILLALIAGEMLYGIIGMILAVPVASLLRTLGPHLAAEYRQFRTGQEQGEPEGSTPAGEAAAATVPVPPRKSKASRK